MTYIKISKEILEKLDKEDLIKIILGTENKPFGTPNLYTSGTGTGIFPRGYPDTSMPSITCNC